MAKPEFKCTVCGATLKSTDIGTLECPRDSLIFYERAGKIRRLPDPIRIEDSI